MKWMIIAIMYMSPNTTLNPQIAHNMEFIFTNSMMCKAFVAEAKVKLRDQVLQYYPKVHQFTLACVNELELGEMLKKQDEV